MSEINKLNNFLSSIEEIVDEAECMFLLIMKIERMKVI
jgi:hypothetical protein